MSWSSITQPLPCRAWAVIGPEGALVTILLSSRESAERMAGQNVRGSVGKARRLGYRVIQVDIREVAA